MAGQSHSDCALYPAGKCDLSLTGGLEGTLIIPLIIFGIAALSLAGCDLVKRELGRSDCASGGKPDEYKDLDDSSYRVFRALWGEQLDRGNLSPGFARFLRGIDPTSQAARRHIGALEALFQTECEGKITMESDRKHMTEYRTSTAASFERYFNAIPDSRDDGVLVLIGGLASVDAGSSLIIDAMNALSIPTEPKSPEREQRSELGQIMKAAYFYNVAAAKADPAGRYRMEHGRLKLKPAEKTYVRKNISTMKGILEDVDMGVLTEAQRVFPDTLVQAADNLKKSLR